MFVFPCIFVFLCFVPMFLPCASLYSSFVTFFMLSNVSYLFPDFNRDSFVLSALVSVLVYMCVHVAVAWQCVSQL